MDKHASPDRSRAYSQWLAGLRPLAGRGYAVALAAPLLGGVLLVAQAFALARTLDAAVTVQQGVYWWAGAVVGLMLARTALAVMGEHSGVAAAERIKLAVRHRLATRLLRQQPATGSSLDDRRSSGARASGLVEQVDGLDGFFARFLPAMISASVLPIAFAAIALPFDWLAALLLLVTAPLILVFMALVGWGAEAATRRQAGALSRLAGRFADRLAGLTTLSLFGRAEAEIAAMHAAGEELRGRTMRVLRIAFLSSAVLEFFAALGVAGMALYIGLSLLGLVHVRAVPLDYRTGLFLLLLAPEVYQPLRLLAAQYHDRAAARAAAAEIEAQFATLPEQPDISATCGVVPAARDIVLADFGVRLPDGRPLLGSIDLELAAGAHIAILGASGAGKTSLIEAMARLRLHDGRMLVGGAAPEEMGEAALRQVMAFVPQRPRLFAGSIADNIRLGRRDASDAEIIVAAETACLSRVLARAPLGLATPLGDGGLGLSGGEIQRVALARLYLRDPAVILLDEPTAHLDRHTEAEVIERLLDFAAGRTLIAATHSAAVAAGMDRAYRLVGGALLQTPINATHLMPTVEKFVA